MSLERMGPQGRVEEGRGGSGETDRREDGERVHVHAVAGFLVGWLYTTMFTRTAARHPTLLSSAMNPHYGGAPTH